jgi:DHA2 family multidrug resistance protein
MLERRTQYHQSVLVSNITSADVMLRNFVNTSSRYLITRGASGPDAIHQSYAMIANLMNQQAAMLAFMDCFRLLAVVVALGVPLAFLIRRFEIGKAAGAAH